MADHQSLTAYGNASPESELVNRPDKTYSIRGQAGFLAIAIALDVPILSAQNNVVASMNPVAAGVGASFAVSSAVGEMKIKIDEDFANHSPGMREWVKELQSKGKFRRHVTKKIVTSQGYHADDSRQLAAIINEIRILSNETIRECDFIVSMLGVSWFEYPSIGRFWPQVLLEAAEEGTLSEYISSVDVNFPTQISIAMGIARGLEFLHSHGIVHCDLKPNNVLVFTSDLSSDQKELCEKSGIEPVRPKLCDFGYAVIINDYQNDKLFQARVGSFPWMPPELDMEQTVPLEDLHKSDIYCLGLLAASVFMKCTVPFDGLSSEEILSVKLNSPEHANSLAKTVVQDIKDRVFIDKYQEEFIETLLQGTCAPIASDRVSLAAIQSYLFLGMMQNLGRGTPSIPIEYFPDLREVFDGYKGALSTFEKKHSKSKPDKQLSESDKDGEEILARRRAILDELISLRIGNPELETTLGGAFEDHSLSAVKTRRLAKPKTTDDDMDFRDRMDEVFDRAITKVPDFAFERNITPSLLPRVARKEMLKDLQTQADNEGLEDPSVLFHLAGAYFNGQITDPDPDLGLAYLTKAALMKDPEAISVILNVYKGCNATLPDDICDVLLAEIKDYGMKTFSGAQATLFDLKIMPLQPQDILARTWAKEWPESYVEFLDNSRDDSRRVIHSTTSLLNNPLFLHAEEKTHHPVFDFDRMNSYRIPGPEKLQLFKKQNFIDEIRRYGCLDSCDKSGFTLLQTAAVKDDIEMAKILIQELGASVDACGNTYGWTPLLLSAHCGYFDFVQLLVDNGADPARREELRGATILHSLNRFSERKHCEAILNIALSADLDINCMLKNGLTPLHAVFTGWDYSNGVAAELLLENGADPTRRIADDDVYLNFQTPIGLAANLLDVELLCSMLDAAESRIKGSGVSARRQLNYAKAQAFSEMRSKTRFYFMSVVGQDYETKLETVLSLILDEDCRAVLREKQGIDVNSDIDPCINMISQSSHGFLFEALFSAFPETPANFSYHEPIRSYLHVAIERRGLEAVRCLVRYGADLLAKDQLGQHALHTAAHYFPSVLVELVEELENLPPEKLGGFSVQDILEAQNEGGATVLGLLLQEGYEDEIPIADFLRTKYDLEYDYEIGDDDGDWLTLPGRLITIAAGSGLIPLEQIQYLLNLDPQPEFVCGSNGETLLTCAVQGFMASRFSHDLPCHQITSLVLESYPAYSNLLQPNEGRNALHMAAYWSNKTALQMIKDHVKEKCKGEVVPWNTQASTNTVLDFCTVGIRQKKLSDEVLARTVTKAALSAGLECYAFLRENGALHNYELKGVLIATRLMCWNIDFAQTAIFMRYATQALGLQSPDIDLDNVVEISDTAGPGARLIRIPVVELVWRYDNFFLKFYSVRLSSRSDECLEQFRAHSKVRFTSEATRYYTFMELIPGIYPWMTLNYEYQVPGTEHKVRWTRSGRVWTEKECDDLREKFTNLWDMFFGEEEKKLIAQMEG